MPTREYKHGDAGFAEALRKAKLDESGRYSSVITTTPEIVSRDALSADIAAALTESDEPMKPIRFVASSEKVARDGDIIRAKGWDLKAFRANPVVLWSHNAWELPIGRAVETKVIRKDEKIGPHLDILVDFAPSEPTARRVHKLIETGFLNATSVKWRTLAFQVPADDEREGLGLGPFGVVVTRSELLEVSIVTVPSDPAALKKRADEALDGDLVSPDDLAVLYDAQVGNETISAAVRAIATAAAEGAIEKFLAKSRGDSSGDVPSSPPTGDEAGTRPSSGTAPTKHGDADPRAGSTVPDYFAILERIASDIANR